MRKFNVAVVGATGAVGEEMLRVLEEVDFPIAKLTPLASARSAGGTVEYKGEEVVVKELSENIFEEEDVEIALFSAGGSISAKYAPFAVEAGAVVVDNTSHFRMDPDVPLVVPEVNPQDIAHWREKGIIANPNCSTIQMVQALKPLDDEYGIERIDISTYQATSGAGKSAMDELVNQMQAFFAFKLEDSPKERFPHQIALNTIPQIDIFMDNGFTKEEMKMVNETNKIMHDAIEVAATCVRVPTLRGHAESITVTCKRDIDADTAREVIARGENIVVMDDPKNSVYPMPIFCVEKNETFVGRIRNDIYKSNVLHMFVVADNLRVGAATNAVRIAQKWVELESE